MDMRIIYKYVYGLLIFRRFVESIVVRSVNWLPTRLKIDGSSNDNYDQSSNNSEAILSILINKKMRIPEHLFNCNLDVCEFVVLHFKVVDTFYSLTRDSEVSTTLVSEVGYPLTVVSNKVMINDFLNRSGYPTNHHYSLFCCGAGSRQTHRTQSTFILFSCKLNDYCKKPTPKSPSETVVVRLGNSFFLSLKETL